MTTVRSLPPGSDELAGVLAALHPAVVASAAQDQPFEPPPTLAVFCSQVLTPWWGDVAHLVVAERDGAPVGCAVVELPAYDNPHVAGVELHVADEHRRQGVGRALWAGALDVVREQGRRSVVLEARADSAVQAFARAMGMEPALSEVRRHQDLRTVDAGRVAALREEAARAAAGYRLETWTGPTPEPLRAPLAAATESLNDAPLGSLDWDDERWDADRVAQRDGRVAGARLRMHSALALAPDGDPAGFTDVAVSEDGTYAWQWGTGVAPAHRGHRLGMLLKATMVEQLRAREPAVQVLSTWNAGENQHMIAVNEALGYVPVDVMTAWQCAVPERSPAA